MKGRKNIVIRTISVLLALALVMTCITLHPATVRAASTENVVILYFSATGTTKAVAKKIKKSTGGKLIEIKASEPYTEDDLDWTDDDSRVVTEHESADSPAESSVRPEIKNLKSIKKAVKNADIVYIGYPIWWGEAPHILYTLVENVSLKNKTVIPFCTSLSSGLGDSATNLKANATINSKTVWNKGKNYYDVPSQKTVDKWVKSLKN
jgi:flavodoxin